MAKRKTCPALFATLFFAYAYIHQKTFDGPIGASRMDLLYSIATHRTININAYHHNTPDKAVYNGNYYCDKAPGVVVLALPAFLAAFEFLHLAAIHTESKRGWLITSWLSTAFSVGSAAAFGGVTL